MLRKYGKSAPLTTDRDNSGLLDLDVLWSGVSLIPCLPSAGIINSHIAPWILWELWTARNRLVFEGFARGPMDSLSRAITAAREWEAAQVPQQKSSQRSSIPCMQPQTATVLRSDAAWRVDSTVAGLGWTISTQEELREYTGLEQQVFSPLMGEALALRAGLEKCREMGIYQVKCESDSKLLINSIKNGNALPELYGVVADILCIANEFASISFVWISRENNRAADVLAKQSLNVFGGGSPPT